MNLIVCVDERNGLLFGGRRQSRDRVVCQKILSLAAGARLWMNNYSGGLFSGLTGDFSIDEDFLEKAETGDYCFLENSDYIPHINKFERVILFKWNRHYPADKHFLLNLNDGSWTLFRMEEFSGHSHKLITMEEYIR